MNQFSFDGIPLWRFNLLDRVGGVSHLVSGRTSDQPGIDFNLSYSHGASRELVTRHRASLASALGIYQLHFPAQVHASRIVRVDGNTTKENLTDTDALITDTPGVGIAIMVADCVPILLFDPVNCAVGAVHSGWRGTVAKILEKTLNMMKDIFGTRGDQLIAAIGPSVSQGCYEVGDEVIQATTEAFGRQHNLLHPTGEGRAKLDLWQANKLQLLEFGVPEQQIEIAGLCTVTDNDQFFSARMGDRHRFAAAIVIA
jgi:YfiH family protein